MRTYAYTVILVAFLAPAAGAQEAVRPVPDVVSYGTAAINPSIALWKALHSSDKLCQLSRLGVAEIVGNGATLTIKRLRFGHPDAERPCAGCTPDGDPSGHSMNGAIGAFSSGWGISFALPTPWLRVEANRHTKTQAVKGTLLGLGAEAFSHLIVKCS